MVLSFGIHGLSPIIAFLNDHQYNAPDFFSGSCGFGKNHGLKKSGVPIWRGLATIDKTGTSELWNLFLYTTKDDQKTKDDFRLLIKLDEQ